MIEERPQLVDLRRTRANFNLCIGDILPILPATGVRTERRGEKSQRSLNSVGLHLPQRIGQKWFPISIAEINRQLRTMLLQFSPQRGNERTVLRIERAYTAKVIIMLRHRQQPLARHIATTQHVFQKRNYFVAAFRSTERNDQHRLIGIAGRIHKHQSAPANGSW